ncbi:MAG: vancomycin high temperature exclusion protein [Anaerovoracaceae bacterium]
MGRIKRFFLKMLLAIIVIAMIAGLACILINSRVVRTTEDKIAYTVRGEVEIKSFAVDNLKNFDADCIMVLGCGIEDEETPSPMLKDRLDVGIELYKQGAAPKILLTGDNGTEQHNEIHVMLKYTKEAGVPEKDIFCDHAGFSTYESMYRAGSIFNAERVIVVTQTYHQYRALYIGDKLGLEVMGVASDQQTYFGQRFRESREILARIKDFFKSILRSKPTYGGEVIPISGSGISSHGE